jgi:hypothetical protein
VSFSQEKNLQTLQPIIKLDAQQIASEHNKLLKEFWGSYLPEKEAEKSRDT